MSKDKDKDKVVRLPDKSGGTGGKVSKPKQKTKKHKKNHVTTTRTEKRVEVERLLKESSNRPAHQRKLEYWKLPENLADLSFKASTILLKDYDIASYINISTSTLREWKRKDEEFRMAIQRGHDYARQQLYPLLLESVLNRTKRKTSYAINPLYAEDDERYRQAYNEVVEEVTPSTRDVLLAIKNLSNTSVDWQTETSTIDLNLSNANNSLSEDSFDDLSEEQLSELINNLADLKRKDVTPE